MTLKDQIEEQEAIRSKAVEKRNQLISLRTMCKHEWKWDLTLHDERISRQCEKCGVYESFYKAKENSCY